VTAIASEERTAAHTKESEALAALVRSAQEGDREAFDALYAATAGRVFSVCLRLCADRAAAERFTQDAFVTAWRRLGTSAATASSHRGCIALQ
jgi:RNA polymerase sigma-70 factor, ECF subfamily